MMSRSVFQNFALSIAVILTVNVWPWVTIAVFAHTAIFWLFALPVSSPAIDGVWTLSLSIGFVGSIMACEKMAERKHYSPVFGFLGFFSLFGIVAVSVLPNREPRQAEGHAIPVIPIDSLRSSIK